ncbi:MAG: nitroreductase/quinone reductase family protein [Nitrosopumilaceae archaeon]|nr:nitroreductase/quinone reductase family protein [Nitrosopumilaceae archaeon]
MKIQRPFRALLITKGRKSSKDHSVMLRGVWHDDKIYFSRHRPDSDWFKNALSNPEVEIIIDNERYLGTAKKVEDDLLNQKISELKYPGQDRAKEKRVAIEITLYE